MEDENYYKIPVSMWWFWFWLIIMGLFTVISMGALFFCLIIPIIVYLQLKKTNYLYNDKELVIRKGLIFKVSRNIAISKIEEVNVKIGLLNLIVQAKSISLMNIQNIQEESNRFIKNWNNNR